MLVHKDIIIRVIFSFIFFGITLMVLGPVFMAYIKKKLPGQYSHETDIDIMIKRQKERFRSQYGLTGDLNSDNQNKISRDSTDDKTDNNPVKLSNEIKQIYKETQWGGGTFLKELQTEITKNYSYTVADSKVNAFVLLCEKRNYLRFLTEEHRESKVAIKNYLVTMFIFLLSTEETKEKQFFILEKISKKLEVPPQEMALALQIKLLMTVANKKGLKEERVFSENLVLGQYSEDTVRDAIEAVAKREANLWAKDPSIFFEELTLALKYSSMLTPIPKLKNRKDLDTAYEILNIRKEISLDEVKKAYKKIALQKHPDKIVSQKLPKILETKGIDHFNQIQEAYEVILAHKK